MEFATTRVRRSAAVVFLAALAVGIGVLLWAHWTPSVEDLLAPARSLDADLHLERHHSRLCRKPILVLIDSADENVFARYVTQILKAEGVLGFETMNLSATEPDSTVIACHDLVVVASSSPRTVGLRNLLSSYVHSGGRLFVCAPRPEFDSLLGLTDLHETISAGYLNVDPSSTYPAALGNRSLLFFGPTRLFLPSESEVVGWIQKDTNSSERYAGIGLRRVGRGKCGYATFDPGRSIVFSRQGRPRSPALSSMDLDGDGVLRTADLFVETADYSRRTIPQADLLQKILVRLLYELVDRNPLVPRVWYFPNKAPAIALLTGDAHQTPANVVERVVRYIEQRGGRFTLIEYPNTLDTTLARSLKSRGHTVAPHIYYQRHSNIFPMRLRLLLARWFSPSYFYRPRLSDVRDEIVSAQKTFLERTGMNGSVTRTHFLVWWGWSETAQLMGQHDIHMDFSFTGLNPVTQFGVPSSHGLKSPIGYGYINGSGLPMKLVDRNGELVDLYAQTTQVEDDLIGPEFVTAPSSDSATIARLTACNRTLIDESADTYHTALVWNFHPLHTAERWPSLVPATWDWFTTVVDHLAERSIPMLSADEWLKFVRQRDDLEISHSAFDTSRATGNFAIQSTTGIKEATFLIPYPHSQPAGSTTAVSVRVNGSPLEFTSQQMSIDGIRFTSITLDIPPHVPATVTYAFSHPR